MSRRGKIIFCSFMTALFLCFIVAGCVTILRLHSAKKRCTFETKGEIVEVASRTSSSKYSVKLEYVPVLAYEYNGKQYEYSSAFSYFKSKPEIGTKVTVMVDPDDPYTVYIPEYTSEWVVGRGLVIIGALMLTVTIIGLVKSLRAGQPVE